jgi:hypothetical protein
MKIWGMSKFSEITTCGGAGLGIALIQSFFAFPVEKKVVNRLARGTRKRNSVKLTKDIPAGHPDVAEYSAVLSLGRVETHDESLA